MATTSSISAGPQVDRLDVSVYTIPTDQPESDGTFEWRATTLVLVELSAGAVRGLGYSYASPAAASVIEEGLRDIVLSSHALANTDTWVRMNAAVRNIGRPGVSSTAIAAVDIALWDLKARLLGLALVDLLGPIHDAVPVYGSGGFTSYSIERLQRQFAGWAEQGIRAMKMKIGRQPDADPGRVAAARAAIGEAASLFVDANGAYAPKQALALAQAFVAYRVTWFEEPVTSDDLRGLRFIRERVPAGMDVAAGEYGYDLTYFGRMLRAGAVDVLQADATRCAGITGFLKAAALCEAAHVPLSAHTAPSIHVHPCAALPDIRPLEYFHDHVRIEHMFFDGAATAEAGVLRPDRSRPGLGLELKRPDVEHFRRRLPS